jgi:hypothetical protein
MLVFRLESQWFRGFVMVGAATLLPRNGRKELALGDTLQYRQPFALYLWSNRLIARQCGSAPCRNFHRLSKLRARVADNKAPSSDHEGPDLKVLCKTVASQPEWS